VIVVININLGNVGSILNMLKKIGVKACLSSRSEDIKKAEKMILPGVGSFDNALLNISELKLMDVINQKVLNDKTPILGICLGAQLMTRNSEEGSCPGFGWIDARTVRFNFDSNPFKLKVPHMGWNQVRQLKDSLLFRPSDEVEERRFYFVHSYHMICDNPADILTTSHYGFDFTSAFARENIYGVQFHPEKSHKYGMRLLQNFADL